MRKLIIALAALPFLASCDQKAQMVKLAEMNISQFVDDPRQMKILGISEPDSAFGTNYFTQKEVKAMVMMMQKVSEDIMKRTDNMTRFDPNDRYVMRMAERQMRAMTEIREMIRQTGRKGEWSGWKIKVDYEAKDKDGIAYKAERWMFLDKKGNTIYKTFEIPIP